MINCVTPSDLTSASFPSYPRISLNFLIPSFPSFRSLSSARTEVLVVDVDRPSSPSPTLVASGRSNPCCSSAHCSEFCNVHGAALANGRRPCRDCICRCSRQHEFLCVSEDHWIARNFSRRSCICKDVRWMNGKREMSNLKKDLTSTYPV